jgi:Uma2 family endonuclease
MSSLSVILEPILHSPRLEEITAILEQKMAEERVLRRKFYEDITPSMKAEFIGGEVVFHSPARNVHLDVTMFISTLLHIFVAKHGLGTVKSEKCLVVFPRNDYEPDVVFFGPEKTAALLPETMQFPIPDLVVEVLSESTEARDRGVKFEDFACHGVREYWIVDAEAQVIEQYMRRGESLSLAMKSGSGSLRCEAIPGLVLPVEALFQAEANLAAIRAML